MERYLEVVEDRLRSALEQMRGSSAGEHYRTLLAALRQFVAKLANSRYGGYRNGAHRYSYYLVKASYQFLRSNLTYPIHLLSLEAKAYR
jgi:hypothetical protein